MENTSQQDNKPNQGSNPNNNPNNKRQRNKRNEYYYVPLNQQNQSQQQNYFGQQNQQQNPVNNGIAFNIIPQINISQQSFPCLNLLNPPVDLLQPNINLQNPQINQLIPQLNYMQQGNTNSNQPQQYQQNRNNGQQQYKNNNQGQTKKSNNNNNQYYQQNQQNQNRVSNQNNNGQYSTNPKYKQQQQQQQQPKRQQQQQQGQQQQVVYIQKNQSSRSNNSDKSQFKKKNKNYPNRFFNFKTPRQLVEIFQIEEKNYFNSLQESNNSDIYWVCTTCNYKNEWRNDKSCYLCKDSKYRPYDRMKKDFGIDDFDYLFFIDYECNNSKGKGSEIIEFPMHVVDVKQQKIINSYQSYVKPSTKISPFITKLTKIKDSDVCDAPILSNVLSDAVSFLQPYLCVGVEKCCVVYDCDSDSNFLQTETNKKKILLHPIFQKYINLKNVFPALISEPPTLPTSLSKMLTQLGMEFQGQQHCGSDDALNQAGVGVHLLSKGYNFSKNQQIKLGYIPKSNKSGSYPIYYLIHVDFEYVDIPKVDISQPQNNSNQVVASDLINQMEQLNINIEPKSNGNQSNEKQQQQQQQQQIQKKAVKIIFSVSDIQNNNFNILVNSNELQFNLPDSFSSQTDKTEFYRNIFDTLFNKLNELNIDSSRFIVVTQSQSYKTSITELLNPLSQFYYTDQGIKNIFMNVYKYLSHYIYFEKLVNIFINNSNQKDKSNLTSLMNESQNPTHGIPIQCKNNISLQSLLTILK